MPDLLMIVAIAMTLVFHDSNLIAILVTIMIIIGLRLCRPGLYLLHASPPAALLFGGGVVACESSTGHCRKCRRQEL